MSLIRSTAVVICILFVNNTSNVSSAIFGTGEVIEDALNQILLYVDGVDGNGNTLYKKSGLRSRVRRYSTEKNSFKETSRLPPIRLMRMMLQIIRNLYTSEDVGGAHPMAHSVPKTFVTFFKTFVYDTLMPDIGPDYDITKKRNNK